MSATSGPRGRSRPSSLLFTILGLAFAPSLLAFEGRLLLPDGNPAAGYEVSVVGRPGTARTGPDGRFRFTPDPPVPFTMIATSPGELLAAPIEVNAPLPEGVADFIIPPAFQDSITVAAGVAPNLETPPAAATVVLGREDLEQRRPQRLSDALEGVAGAARTEEGPTGVPSIRGLARGRTLVLLDGARVTTERRAGASATFLDPFTLGSIEIARGPGSVAYGSDALGGVIDARSRFPEPGKGPALRFDLNGSFGGSDETSAGVEASADVPGGALLGLFHIREAGNAEAGGGEEIPVSSYRDRGGALRYQAQTPLGRLRVGLTADRAYDVERAAVDSDVVRTVYPEELSDRLTVGLAADPAGAWEDLAVDLFVGRYRLVLDRDRLPTPASTRRLESSDTDARDASLRTVAARPLGAGRLRLGAEAVTRFGVEAIAEVERFDEAGESAGVERTRAIEDAERLDLGLFGSYDLPLGEKTLASVGLRGDRVTTDNRGGFFGDRSTEESALSGHAGVIVGPFAHVTASLQVARGFRDPLLSDRYFRGPSGRGLITGNPGLEPESSLQYDGSLRWERGGRTVTLYGYLYDLEDLVERFRDGADFFFRNRGEAEIRGLEIEAQTPLPAGLSLQVAAAVARGEAEDGSALDDIAPPGGWVTLRWAGERGFAFLRTAAFQRDDRPGPTELERPGYATVDLGAGWQATGALELRAIARNLTDRRYVASGDETAPLARGRSLSLGLVGKM